MDLDAAMAKVRGRKRSPGDGARLRKLMRRIQSASEKAGLFRGMTEEQILARLRRTREEVWAETKDAAGTRR